MDEVYYEDVSYTEARKRNLLIAIVRVFSEHEIDVTRKYTKEELSSIFYFRISDLHNYLDEFFQAYEDGYVIHNEKVKTIHEILKKHVSAVQNLKSAKTLFSKSFGRFYEEYEKSNGFKFPYNKFNSMFKAITPIIEILHWGLLPIIPEHLMVNSGVIPENRIIYFYYHYHMLTALLKEVEGEGVALSMKGDLNINKILTFSVYSRRWGHEDTYHIERTIDGWNARHISTNGKCEKNGEGALFSNLHHDNIFFPEEGVSHALENLWNLADENEIPVKELQDKLQQIADWISAVEKVVGENQPEWVGYY